VKQNQQIEFIFVKPLLGFVDFSVLNAED